MNKLSEIKLAANQAIGGGWLAGWRNCIRDTEATRRLELDFGALSLEGVFVDAAAAATPAIRVNKARRSRTRSFNRGGGGGGRVALAMQIWPREARTLGERRPSRCNS